MKIRRFAGAIIAVVFFFLWASLAKSQPASWNDISRIAAIESLVERGTWAIDDSPWLDQTQDKILIDGKFYSDKMPLLSVMGAGLYAILHSTVGGSLAPNCSTAGKTCAYYWLTLVLVGLPAALMLWLFFDRGLRITRPLWAALIATIALGAGTMVFPYALVFNHHLPAAASLFAAFYILSTRPAPVSIDKAGPTLTNPSYQNCLMEHPAFHLGTDSGPSTPPSRSISNQRCQPTLVTRNKWELERSWLAIAGFFTALAVAFDVLAGIIAACLFIVALVRYRIGVLYFAVGAALPLIATVVLDYQIAHTIIPPYMITNAYNYPGSEFPATVGGNGTPDDYPAYIFRMFVGGQGLFAYNPVLLWAFVGAVVAALDRRQSLRLDAVAVLIGFVGLCVYLALGTGNYGGNAYGERWFIVGIPVLFSFILFVPPLSAPRLANPGWIIFVPLFLISALSSFDGARNPWLYATPPLELTRKPDFPILGLRWNKRFR